MNKENTVDITNDRLKALEIVARLSIDNASRALSKSLKTGAKISLSKLYIADFCEITEKMNDDFREMSGVLVSFKGNVTCKLLFMLPLDDSLILTDLFLQYKVGTQKEFDDLTESTVQEVGNIIASHISNTLVSNFDAVLVPQPPRTYNDYAGVIFSNLVLEQGSMHDKLLLLETIFEICNTRLRCYLFLLPELAAFERLLNQ